MVKHADIKGDHYVVVTKEPTGGGHEHWLVHEYHGKHGHDVTLHSSEVDANHYANSLWRSHAATA